MRLLSLYVTFLALLSTTALAVVAPDPWLDEVKKQEPEIWAIVVGGMASEPVPKVGQRVDLFMKGFREAKEQYASSVEPELAELIAGKLESAYASAPPNWPLVILCLRAAAYIPPNDRILKVAARIVDDPPRTGLGEIEHHVDEGLVRGAMWILGNSGREEHGEFLRAKLSDSYFNLLRERGLNPKTIGSRAAISSASMAKKDKKKLALLEKARQQVPDGADGDHIRGVIDGQIQSIQEARRGAVYEEVLLP